MPEKIQPTADDLAEAINRITLDKPGLGIKKVVTRLKAIQPTWRVSENRVKKILQESRASEEDTTTQTHVPATQEQESAQSENNQLDVPEKEAITVEEIEIFKSGVDDDPSVPVSFIDPALDLSSKNVTAKMLDQVTGKGLFAAKDFAKNSIIFEETPLIFFPPWEDFMLARDGKACGLCAKVFLRPSYLMPHCKHCRMYYCSKSCLEEAEEKFHRLECTGLNPAIHDFMEFCRRESWQAPMAVSRIYAHLILAHQRNELEQVQFQFDSFATVNQAERQAKETEWIFMEHPTRELWKKARKLLAKAYRSPPEKCNISKPLPEGLVAKLFDDEDTFLNYLGKFNINNQAGGMYRVHSHINHNCYPNVSIDHNVPRSQYKLSVRAIRDIKEGEQLYETYTNPRWNRETRQMYLAKTYLFDCKCERCEQDGPLTNELRLGLRLRSE